jgi:hypothetical protein
MAQKEAQEDAQTNQLIDQLFVSSNKNLVGCLCVICLCMDTFEHH